MVKAERQRLGTSVRLTLITTTTTTLPAIITPLVIKVAAFGPVIIWNFYLYKQHIVRTMRLDNKL
jgi:hypothetical protein